MKAHAPDISVVVTAAGGDGRRLHAALRSAQRAARRARELGLSTEFVAVLDAPADATLAYFEPRANLFAAVERADFAAAGLARNRGAELSSGKYLAFLDAERLFSENWTAAAHAFAEARAGETLALHPEFDLRLGDEIILASSLDSDAPGYSTLELLEHNPWSPSVFVARSFFLERCRYADAPEGLGRHDRHWNCEAVAAGATHRLVPGTVHFVRPDPPGLRPAEGAAETFAASRLFDPPFHGAASAAVEAARGPADAGAKARALRPFRAAGSRAARAARGAALKFVAPRPGLLDFCVDLKRAGVELLAASTGRAPDAWLVEEWRRIHRIDPRLFPWRESLAKLKRRPAPRSRVARLYPELDGLFGPSPTHVFLLPWLKPGGADIEAVAYMRAAVEVARGRVVCVTTEDAESEWLPMLPHGVRVVELGKALRGFYDAEQAAVLLRLLVQKRPAVVHNINSRLGYKLYTEHGAALSAGSRLFSTLFGVEFMPEGDLGGYGVWDLPNCIAHLERVFTDSGWFAGWLCETFGFERGKFTTVYAPAPGSVNDSGRARDSATRPAGVALNVLWASRMDVEKRPDVLLRVASEVAGSGVHFHVYGTPVYTDATAAVIEKIRQLPNVTTYGTYHGFGSLPVEDYDLFLYTSERDGLPNVLLEATAAGLPVVAPDVGGISELINGETGFLVSRADAVDEYVAFVRRIQGDRNVVGPKLGAARALVASRHSWEAFVGTLARVPGYLGGGAGVSDGR